MLLMAIATMAVGLHATISVDVDKPGIEVSPDLYGIFFEEINCAGDGGLYAELIRNRSFEDSDRADHWQVIGGAGSSATVERRAEAGGNCLRLSRCHIANEGYWGIPVRQGEEYALSLDLRSDGPARKVRVSLEGGGGNVYAASEFEADRMWKHVRASLRSGGTDSRARLVIRPEAQPDIWLDNVSLFPAKTFNSRSNGLRPDLAQMLHELRPSFMRFPGGCWVEGDTMATAMRWKRTVGDWADRRTQANLWGYNSTNGLGYHEYLQLCEDIGAAPLFVINCGMSHREVVPMAQMDEFVQDALDAVEYANGPETSKWGAVRAKNGHPKPFGLKYLEIGNENGGPAYAERFPMIAKAVKDHYPDVKIITNVWGGYPKTPYTEIIDEHYYSSPGFFVQNADRYDAYDRKGPKVYVGEYACTEGCGAGNLAAAVGEAAFMTGMERNSDVVVMASYAPLFANVNYKKWNPDLINFDNHRVYGTPSYYVQQMFSRNRGDRVLPAKVALDGVAKRAFPSGGIGVGTWGTQAEFKDLSVSGVKITPSLSQLKPGLGQWTMANGMLEQRGPEDGTRATFIDPAWSSYTVSLKARKMGGREGFLISFGMRDEKNWLWWNVGGWGNHQHAIEQSVDGGKSMVGKPVEGSVETGRWYDIRIDYSPGRVRCYLDGKLIHDVTPPQSRPLHVVASRAGNDVILKVVNSGPEPIATDLDLRSGRRGYGTLTGEWLILTSGSPPDENTLEEPRKVAPVTRPLRGSKLNLPAQSVSVLRFKSGT